MWHIHFRQEIDNWQPWGNNQLLWSCWWSQSGVNSLGTLWGRHRVQPPDLLVSGSFIWSVGRETIPRMSSVDISQPSTASASQWPSSLETTINISDAFCWHIQRVMKQKQYIWTIIELSKWKGLNFTWIIVLHSREFEMLDKFFSWMYFYSVPLSLADESCVASDITEK